MHEHGQGSEQRATRKAYAYITRGEEVLVLVDLAGSWAGLRQLPGGTLEDGESPEAGVLRECEEETGLRGLRIVRALGVVEGPSPRNAREWQVRHYFHLECEPPPARDRWEHVEATPSGGGGPIPLDLGFEPLEGLELYAHFGCFAEELLRALRSRTP
ncbi:MAG: NUDIX domain-containing protein [Planctomycetes bacterium]|nr:NUDIX domain-containing protein [Planctomycetota bacterium]